MPYFVLNIRRVDYVPPKSPGCRPGIPDFFYILMFAILGWFTYMQFFGADERRLNVNSDSMIYTGTFTWEKSDGTSEEITVQAI